MDTHLSFKQGVKECIPTLLGYAGVGISFGIVAASQHFSLLEIILLCLIVYAGSSVYYLCVSHCRYTDYSNYRDDAYCQFTFFLLSMTLAPNYKQYGLWNR